ncbi:GL12115 [Drosophila persimilis]|uniref:GL12115 n=1 Tax=Drosophila persimilis TaxID=7234 RepID=B4H3C4_DROPE|nr:GL12115 [Drosophila persimilis]
MEGYDANNWTLCGGNVQHHQLSNARCNIFMHASAESWGKCTRVVIIKSQPHPSIFLNILSSRNDRSLMWHQSRGNAAYEQYSRSNRTRPALGTQKSVHLKTPTFALNVARVMRQRLSFRPEIRA